MFSKGMDGVTNTMPIDLHIDLGNHCNLACKMCWSGASTKIASQYVNWGYQEHQQYLGNDWTKDPQVWGKFLDEIIAIPKLKNLHLMGGETLLSPRFEQLVNYMIAHKRFDVGFSFVTNGTVYKPELIAKLKQFARVGIEISIETATEHNDYVRQGSKVSDVLANILKYKQLCNSTNMSVTVRPAISLLTVGYYHTLLQFCLDNNLLIKSLVVTDPQYLQCKCLPGEIRQQYTLPYLALLDELADVDVGSDFNESVVENIRKSIKLQVHQVLVLLDAKPTEPETMADTVAWCQRWDKEYGFNARLLYPELTKVFDQYGY
jgi:sulfatase maturation enzyme AslB (radical SAM superfamily)